MIICLIRFKVKNGHAVLQLSLTETHYHKFKM